MSSLSIIVAKTGITLTGPDELLARVKSMDWDDKQFNLVLDSSDAPLPTASKEEYGWSVYDKVAGVTVASHFTRNEATIFLSGIAYVVPNGLHGGSDRFELVEPEPIKPSE